MVEVLGCTDLEEEMDLGEDTGGWNLKQNPRHLEEVAAAETVTEVVHIGSQQGHFWGERCQEPLRWRRVYFWLLAAGERPRRHWVECQSLWDW